jgi:putative hydrolase of HD superfamily
MSGPLADFLFEIGLLKRYKRTGWLVAGVADPESIADHSLRTAVIAAVIAVLEGANPDRAALLALFHDTQETRLTDLPYLSRPYVTKADNEEVTADQARALPDVLAAFLGTAVGEYEGKASPEAVCARDADKLECLLQAVEYRSQGNQNVQPWIDTSLAQLTTDTAKRIAESALETGCLDWLARALGPD